MANCKENVPIESNEVTTTNSTKAIGSLWPTSKTKVKEDKNPNKMYSWEDNVYSHYCSMS